MPMPPPLPPPSPDLLLLWDIDGTLIATDHAGRRAILGAMEQAFGIAADLDGIDFRGRTDRWIARQLFGRHRLPLDDAHLERFFDAYVDLLPDALEAGRGHVLPGIADLLLHLAACPATALGLLTGNLRRGARAKLAHFGLWDHFPVGAFADDEEDRNRLGPHALARATAHWGRPFSGSTAVVIGDTPFDVACGHAIGARTIALGTGRYPLAELAAAGAHAVLPDCTDAPRFLAACRPPSLPA